MEPFSAATADVVAALNEAGLSASSDPASLNLPGVWVTPGQPTMQFSRLDSNVYVGRWDLYLIAPDLDPVSALGHLTDLVQRVRQTFTPDVTEATAVTIQLANHSAAGLPAMLITLDQEVSP